MDIGTALKRYIDAQSVKLTDLSQVSGLSVSYLSYLVNGKIRDPSSEKVRAICAALHISADDLFCWAGAAEACPLDEARAGAMAKARAFLDEPTDTGYVDAAAALMEYSRPPSPGAADRS